ncbi:hypothetical protein WJX84_004982 [Apatococcus fuscideae]|uniref:PDZ domain-containing protein n=1 Tax=Apatococcus fuscideae TaxID=2026836 RepID=A0AAW1S813_9CHLO
MLQSLCSGHLQHPHRLRRPCKKGSAQPVCVQSTSITSISSSRPRLSWRPSSWNTRSSSKSGFALWGLAAAAAGPLASLSGVANNLQALGVLAAIITIHETGHFFAARSQNIHVAAFSIGFGPSLFSYQGPEVEYSLRLFPLGGYVGFPDDDPDSTIPADDPDLLRNRPVKDRFIVISAGVIANFIFAYSLLVTQAGLVGIPSTNILPGVRVPEVLRQSIAEQAGLKRGDIITRVADMAVPAEPRAVANVVGLITRSPDQQLMVEVDRRGQKLSLPITPAPDVTGGGRIGIQLAPNAKLSYKRPQSPVQVLTVAADQFGRLTSTVTSGLAQIVLNFEKTKDSISGPVAIVKAGGDVAKSDLSGLFQFAAIVNINLGVVNLLPFPALDGGYLVLLIIEALRGKKLEKPIEQTITASGLLLLVSLGLFLVVRDTLNLGGFLS